jgi:hypothetical protein
MKTRLLILAIAFAITSFSRELIAGGDSVAKFMYRAPARVDAEKAVQSALPERESGVRIERVPHSDVFHLIVAGTDPAVTSKRAAQLVLALRDRLRDRKDPSNFSVLTLGEPVDAK